MHRIAIPEVPTAQLPADLQEVARSGALVNVFRIMLRSPQIAARVVQLGAAQRRGRHSGRPVRPSNSNSSTERAVALPYRRALSTTRALAADTPASTAR